MDSLEGFENISTNVDLIMHIFRCLEYEDQLRLSCASTNFNWVFVSMLHKGMYRSMRVVRRASDFFVANEQSDHPVLLRPSEFEDFMQAYAEQVEHLAVGCADHMYRQNCTLVAEMMEWDYVFPNLVTLSCEQAALPATFFQATVRKCPNLQQLSLIHCKISVADSSREPAPLEIGDNVAVSPLLSMSKLKQLTLENSFVLPPGLRFEHFRDLIDLSHLEVLHTPAMLTSHSTYLGARAGTPKLKELSITTTFDRNKWQRNFPCFAKYFQNLRTLNLGLTDTVDDAILASISTVCEKLEDLTISQTIFGEVHRFAIPDSVVNFRLENCRGLSFACLKQILSKPTLKTFTSRGTYYYGELHNFELSPTLEAVDIDSMPTKNLSCLYLGNERLKKLTWYQDWEDAELDGVQNLQTCTNLEVLNIQGGFFFTGSLLHLRNLKVLNITVNDLLLNAFRLQVMPLLEHPSLTHLTLDFDDQDNLDLQPMADEMVTVFNSNIQQLKLAHAVFDLALHFWMGMLDLNPQMELECINFSGQAVDTVYRIMEEDLLSNDVTRFNLWGFDLDMEAMNDCYEMVVDECLEKYEDLFPEYRMDRLLLSRK